MNGLCCYNGNLWSHENDHYLFTNDWPYFCYHYYRMHWKRAVVLNRERRIAEKCREPWWATLTENPCLINKIIVINFQIIIIFKTMRVKNYLTQYEIIPLSMLMSLGHIKGILSNKMFIKQLWSPSCQGRGNR